MKQRKITGTRCKYYRLMELGHKLTSRQKGFPQSEGILWELSSPSDSNAGYPAEKYSWISLDTVLICRPSIQGIASFAHYHELRLQQWLPLSVWFRQGPKEYEVFITSQRGAGTSKGKMCWGTKDFWLCYISRALGHGRDWGRCHGPALVNSKFKFDWHRQLGKGASFFFWNISRVPFCCILRLAPVTWKHKDKLAWWFTSIMLGKETETGWYEF